MTLVYRGTCDSCHRTSLLIPAPGTPENCTTDNLFCLNCHEKGRAIYREYKEPGFWSKFLGGVCGITFLCIITFGFIEFCRVCRESILILLR